jgi:hypothetical protein
MTRKRTDLTYDEAVEEGYRLLKSKSKKSEGK